ncbi:MAG: portal protein, partial [Syntrophales bacterium]|nr:portal protein [Syntrophales bacterium]
MKKEDKDILDLAKERYKIACEGWDDVYKEASNDLKFVYDIDEGQWPPQIRAARERDGRPVTTVNKLQKFVRQLRGDLQQNRPRVKVIPVDDKGDVQMAELYSGLIRQIEYLSSAEIAYDTGYMHAVSCSVGYFRLITQFGENSFDQDIYIKRILNPLSVRLDPSAVEFTFEDAKYGFIEELVDKKEFKKLYPKAAVTDFEGKKSLFGDWLYKDKVRVVEYFYKEPVEKKLVQLSTREVIELGGEVTKEDIEAKGFTIVQERTEQAHQVKWCRMNGAEVLEKADWAGKYIPIIPVLGDEIVVEGKKYYLSLARGAKGPQEMYNYWADLSIKTMICTPNGWDTLENIHIGDSVFDEKGKPCKVIGESPTLNKEKSYKVMFSNGSFVVASADHLWTVNRGSECGKVIQTRDIDIDNDSISLTEPLDLPEKELKIPPYVLGLWLSDGNSRYTEIFAHKKTVDELAGYLVADGCILSPKRIACKETETYGLYMRGIRKYFVNYGLLNNKHIPTDYLRASHMQRLELLRGLMDGDGSCRSGHQVRFASKSNQLASDFSELLYTLGLKGNYNQDKDGINHFYFTAYMPVFKLKYKLERQITGRKKNEKQSCRYRIVFIEEIEGIPTKCITVDSPNSLFLAGDGMIPTHNTSATETVALAPKSPF